MFGYGREMKVPNTISNGLFFNNPSNYTFHAIVTFQYISNKGTKDDIENKSRYDNIITEWNKLVMIAYNYTLSYNIY